MTPNSTFSCINRQTAIFMVFLLAMCLFPATLTASPLTDSIDKMVAGQDYDSLDALFADKMGTEDLKVVSEHTLDIVRKNIVKTDYDTAKKLLEIILLYDFENLDAQDIYVSVEQLKKEKDEIERREKERETEKKLAELEKSLKEKDKIAKEKRVEEIMVMLDEGKVPVSEIKRIILNEGLDIDLGNFEELERARLERERLRAQIEPFTKDDLQFNAYIGAADFSFNISQFYTYYYQETKPNFKYGLSTNLSFSVNRQKFATSLDVAVDAFFADLYPGTAVSVFYKIMSATTIKRLKIPLYLHAGFAQMIYYYPPGLVTDVLVTNLVSPVIGVHFKNWFFNDRIGIDFYLDYYAVSLFTTHIDASFDTSFSLLTKIYSKGIIGMVFRTELYGMFLVGYGKLESTIKLKLSLGITLNEK
jgi:hypothetical protein